MNVLDKIVEKIKTQILCSIRFFENCAVCQLMSKKYGGAREAADDNMAARCVLDTYG
jgi:hypothetical protein